jgi:hypothetical protein
VACGGSEKIQEKITHTHTHTHTHNTQHTRGNAPKMKKKKHSAARVGPRSSLKFQKYTCTYCHWCIDGRRSYPDHLRLRKMVEIEGAFDGMWWEGQKHGKQRKKKPRQHTHATRSETQTHTDFRVFVLSIESGLKPIHSS